MIYSEDPKKSGKPTPKELEMADQFAKRFALRKGLIFGENAHVGDSVPKFVDNAGNELQNSMQNRLPMNTIMDIRKVPTYVKELQMGDDNIPYFIDESTGDIQFVHPDIARSPRFNPMRGKPIEEQALASNVFNRVFQ